MVNLLVLVSGFFGVFVLLNNILRAIFPMTSKQLALKKDDPKAASKTYAYHIACLVAAIHGFVATIVGILFVLVNGVTYAQPNREIEHWPIAVI